MAESEQDHPGVRVPPPLVALAAIALGLGLDALWPAPYSTIGLPPADAASVTGGVSLLVIGLGLALASLRRFRAAGTAVEPWKPASALVGQGLYQMSRNPIYLGLLISLLGVALIADSLWLAALLVPVWAFLRFAVIAREERYLEARFGEAYRRYRASVRRWL